MSIPRHFLLHCVSNSLFCEDHSANILIAILYVFCNSDNRVAMKDTEDDYSSTFARYTLLQRFVEGMHAMDLLHCFLHRRALNIL